MLNAFMDTLRTTTNLKRSRAHVRVSRARSILVLLVMFMTYFVLAKPAMAAANHIGVMSLVFADVSDIDHANPGGASGQDDAGEHDCAGLDLEMDDFLVSPTHFDFGDLALTFEPKDLHLSLPAFERGLDWPPELI